MAATTTIPLINRELSRLDYNRRVLARAQDSSVPLLERLRFLIFCARNLDEFFMVRAGATRDLIDAGVSEPSPDGLTPSQQMAAMREGARALLEEMSGCLGGQLIPALREHGVVIESFESASETEQQELREYFRAQVAPVLTPLAIDPGHPFPFVANLNLNLAVRVASERGGEHIVLIKVPDLLPRFVAVGGGDRFVPIGSIITAHLEHFFPSLEIRDAVLFRVIRNSEYSIDDDEVQDLRATVEAELRRRERKQVVCLEIESRAADSLVDELLAGTRARREDIYRVGGLLKMSDLEEIYDRAGAPLLRYPEFNPRLPQRFAGSDDIFSIIAQGDILLHRPYDSFMAIVELLHAAATDPSVIAIKQTLYSTDEESPVVDKLALAAMNGKQVAVVIELQARFEERQNLALAARLQDAGVQVVYGLVGLQTHAKLSVVIRAEGDALRHYVHLSTGNYNADSAREYTDFDLLTANDAIGREASQLMNVLTGYSATSLREVLESSGNRPRWKQLAVAPFDYHRWLLARIEREAAFAAQGKPASIIAKLNSLVDPQVIQALYAASTAGVDIQLYVRSMCSLVPGLAGVSERIRVWSTVDRFLEHSRVVRFENGGAPELFLSSGDWMPRNFRRVEVTFPLTDPATQASMEKILTILRKDTASAWDLQSDGRWTRRRATKPASSQETFIDLARAEAVRMAPYEEAIKRGSRYRMRRKKEKGKR